MRWQMIAVSLLLSLLLMFFACTRIDTALNREELEGYADQFLEALTARDPGMAPLSQRVRYTENGQHLDVGDGMWNTADARGGYSLYIADSVTNQIGFMGTISENGTLGILGFRLKIEDRQISEIEVVIARDDSCAQLLEDLGQPHPVFLKSIPPSERLSREKLISTANMYFEGLQLDDGKGEYPFTANCNRLENGMQTTNKPSRTPKVFDVSALGCKEQFEIGFFRFVTRIRDRRLVVVDEERGLVFAFAFFDHAGNIPVVTLTNGMEIPISVSRPWTWEIAELFKIEKGLIRQVEAITCEAPYGMLSGWSSRDEGMSTQIQYE